jgi:hypothetical protein
MDDMCPLFFKCSGENITACEFVVVSPHFMEEDQEKVMQLSIFKVHPKFVSSMEGIIVIGFWKLDLGTFWRTIAIKS